MRENFPKYMHSEHSNNMYLNCLEPPVVVVEYECYGGGSRTHKPEITVVVIKKKKEEKKDVLEPRDASASGALLSSPYPTLSFTLKCCLKYEI